MSSTFAADAPSEQTGFELSVPPARSVQERLGSARFALLARRAIPSSQVGQLEWLHPAPQLGQQLLGLPVSKFVNAPTLRPGIEHFQAATIGVDLVITSEIGKSLEDAE